MTQADLIQLLQKLVRDYKKKVFSLREIARLAGISRPAAGMILLRAEKKGVVSRVANCWINRMDPPELLEIAFALVSPSYLSFESALYQQGLLSQSPRGALTVATSKRPRRIETPLGTIEFIHLKPSLFFGYNSQRTAYPEKAWLDLLYIRGRRALKEKLGEKFYLDRLQQKGLERFAKKFPSWVRNQYLKRPSHTTRPRGIEKDIRNKP